LAIIDRGDLDEITREIGIHVHGPAPEDIEAEAAAAQRA
jgi:hypothetical protein